MPLSCIRIGHGHIGAIHQDEFSRLGVRTLGVVETDPQVREALQQAGLQTFARVEQALEHDPDFFDICVPTLHHAEVIEQVVLARPYANILVEKPLCDLADLERIEHLTRTFRGRVVVNEQYVSSGVVKALLAKAAELRMVVDRVVIESTKHRGADFIGGRFWDKTLGALGYEGSHLLAMAEELGHPIDFSRVLDLDMDGIELPTVSQETQTATQQGGACIQYVSHADCTVDLYTSTSGIVGFPCPPMAPIGMHIRHGDLLSKYRHVRVHGRTPQGTSYQLAGFMDPVPGLGRNLGALVVYRDWKQLGAVQTFEDDTMQQHFQRVIDHFDGRGPNPYSVTRALSDVRALNEWAKRGWDMTDDSDDELGSHEFVVRRLAEAQRFEFLGVQNTPDRA